MTHNEPDTEGKWIFHDENARAHKLRAGIEGPAHAERVTGIEPAYLAWEASALPLSYTREGP